MPRCPAQNHCVTCTLHSAGTTAKVLVVHSLSPATEKGEDDYFGVSDDSGDVKGRRFANCYCLILYESKWYPLKSGPTVRSS